MPMREPRPASYFRLTLGGKESVGVFKEAAGFDSETEVIEHKSIDANGRPYTRKVAGGIKWSNITLKRGVDESLDIWKWRQDTIDKGVRAIPCDLSTGMLGVGKERRPDLPFVAGDALRAIHLAAVRDVTRPLLAALFDVETSSDA